MSFCAICTGDAVGALHEVIDGKRVLVCKRCREETPRAGGYSFASGGRALGGNSNTHGCTRATRRGTRMPA